jgi:hypothetical protein
MGIAWPALGASAVRILTFMIPAIWMSASRVSSCDTSSWLLVATVLCNGVVSFTWLQVEMRKRLA